MIWFPLWKCFWDLFYIWSIELKVPELWLSSNGGEGCLEEVFDGGALREELGFISHAIPHTLKNRQHFFKKHSASFNPCKSPPHPDPDFGVVTALLVVSFWGFVLSRVTFPQPPSSKLSSPNCYLTLRKTHAVHLLPGIPEFLHVFQLSEFFKESAI